MRTPREIRVTISLSGVESKTTGGVAVEVISDQRCLFRVDGDPVEVCQALATWWSSSNAIMLAADAQGKEF